MSSPGKFSQSRHDVFNPGLQRQGVIKKGWVRTTVGLLVAYLYFFASLSYPCQKVSQIIVQVFTTAWRLMSHIPVETELARTSRRDSHLLKPISTAHCAAIVTDSGMAMWLVWKCLGRKWSLLDVCSLDVRLGIAAAMVTSWRQTAEGWSTPIEGREIRWLVTTLNHWLNFSQAWMTPELKQIWLHP